MHSVSAPEDEANRLYIEQSHLPAVCSGAHPRTPNRSSSGMSVSVPRPTPWPRSTASKRKLPWPARRAAAAAPHQLRARPRSAHPGRAPRLAFPASAPWGAARPAQQGPLGPCLEPHRLAVVARRFPRAPRSCAGARPDLFRSVLDKTDTALWHTDVFARIHRHCQSGSAELYTMRPAPRCASLCCSPFLRRGRRRHGTQSHDDSGVHPSGWLRPGSRCTATPRRGMAHPLAAQRFKYPPGSTRPSRPWWNSASSAIPSSQPSENEWEGFMPRRGLSRGIKPLPPSSSLMLPSGGYRRDSDRPAHRATWIWLMS